MFTVKEISKMLNVSLGVVYKAIASERLSHHRFGNAIRISREQLDEWLDQTRTEAGNPSLPIGTKHLDL